MSLFRLYVRLFLNSFGIQAAMSTVGPFPFFGFNTKTIMSGVLGQPAESQSAGIIHLLHQCPRLSTNRIQGLCKYEHVGEFYTCLHYSLVDNLIGSAIARTLSW